MTARFIHAIVVIVFMEFYGNASLHAYGVRNFFDAFAFLGSACDGVSVTSSSLGWIFLCLSPSSASHSNGAGHISIMMLENADGYILVLPSQDVRELAV